jgi:bacillopeptidase F (M6 metalloprotease family)
LAFDLSPFAGEPSVTVAIDYVTDNTTLGAGVWIDNLALDDSGANLYASDLEDSSDWINDTLAREAGWDSTPALDASSHFYMLEWRNDQGSIASEGHKGQ